MSKTSIVYRSSTSAPTIWPLPEFFILFTVECVSLLFDCVILVVAVVLVAIGVCVVIGVVGVVAFVIMIKTGQ